MKEIGCGEPQPGRAGNCAARSFVMITEDPSLGLIVRSVVHLGRNLGFALVAEGVENAAQFAWLGEADCDQYQGFLFSPPLCEDKFRFALANGLEAAVK